MNVGYVEYENFSLNDCSELLKLFAMNLTTGGNQQEAV